MTAVSVVVPVRDGAACLRETLPALVASLPGGAELIVADDGSRDDSAGVAESLGARALRHEHPTGPAAARNRGAREARGGILVFLDADVRVHPDTLDRLLEPLTDPGVAAAFGSYDDTPAARSWVSLYKNLAHHYVHQRSREDASTFWAGCGAVRADAFARLRGFDESYRRPSIEDVELGYRLRAAGLSIRLVKDARVTHLKRWTLGSWLFADFRDRALPWARLVRAGRGLPRELNFTGTDRAATVLVGFAGGALVLAAALRAPAFLAAGGAAVVLALVLDGRFLLFAARRESAGFAAAAAVLQLLHRAVGLAGLLAGLAVSRGPGTLK